MDGFEIVRKISELAEEALKCDSGGYPNWDSYFNRLSFLVDSFVNGNIKDKRTYDDFYNVFRTDGEGMIASEVVENVVKRKFPNLPFGIAVGVQKTTYYRFELLYVVENVNTISEMKDKLALLAGVVPSPYGTFPYIHGVNYDGNWGSTDFVVIKDYDEIGLDYLVILATQNNYEHIYD